MLTPIVLRLFAASLLAALCLAGAAFARYAGPPAEHERVLQTFCGT